MQPTTSITLSEDLRAAIMARAKKNHRSMGAEIRYLCEIAMADDRSAQARELAESIEAAQ